MFIHDMRVLFMIFADFFLPPQLTFNVKTLRTLGCSSHAHVPKVERRKLELKAKKCVFLGYGEQKKGYRLLDINSVKSYSRDLSLMKESGRQ